MADKEPILKKILERPGTAKQDLGGFIRSALRQGPGILVFTVLWALAFNALSSVGIPLLPVEQTEVIKGLKDVSLVDVRRYMEAKGALLIDARSPQDFANGHILGAVNLPLECIEESYRGELRLLAAEFPVITYCGGEECHSSVDLAIHLSQEGCRDVRVFYGGWDIWREAGLPVETGISDGSVPDDDEEFGCPGM
ncbi:rhodanese-like domain-containing protein [Thermodesulfobacteriota bacterium]